MGMQYIFYLCLLLVVLETVKGQEIDLSELATTLSQEDIPVRVPPSQFKFNKDRTPSSISKRIIGGGVATAHEYPFQVALYIYVHITLYFCGGSLITPDWVLTAAHCMEYATSTLVILGAHALNETESSRVIYNTTTYIIHENWDSSTIQYDIALIKLPQSATLDGSIGTIPIASGTETYSGLIGRCLGWGRTILGSMSNVLRYVDAEVITNEKCSSYDEYASYIVDQHLCASGDGYVGSCNGDSGGPLIVDDVQIGIVSFGYTDCVAGYPSVYTRITNFYDWVNQTIENYADSNDETGGNASKSAPFISIYLGLLVSTLIVNCV